MDDEAASAKPQQRDSQRHGYRPAMSDAGLCAQTSDWVLDQLQTTRPEDGAVIAINLSARLLHDEAFAQRLFERLDQGRLEASRLILEITEDTLETDLRAASRVLLELKRRGVRIALDDFGTGRASLSHLRRFPFDYLKIDRSFVAGIGNGVGNAIVVERVAGMGRSVRVELGPVAQRMPHHLPHVLRVRDGPTAAPVVHHGIVEVPPRFGPVHFPNVVYVIRKLRRLMVPVLPKRNPWRLFKLDGATDNLCRIHGCCSLCWYTK